MNDKNLKSILRNSFANAAFDPADIPLLVSRVMRLQYVSDEMREKGMGHPAFDFRATITKIANDKNRVYNQVQTEIRSDPGLLFRHYTR